MDLAIQYAYRKQLPVRVIVVDGKMGDEDSENGASEVLGRLLDPEPWKVKEYDWMSGDIVLSRIPGGLEPEADDRTQDDASHMAASERTGGLLVDGGDDSDGDELAGPKFVDQFSSTDDLLGTPTRKNVSNTVFERSVEVRRKVLARARGKCELCERKGFVTVSGALYLETHHVVPLSEGGADSESNVVALCPDDHRRAHYAVERDEVRHALLGVLTRRCF